MSLVRNYWEGISLRLFLPRGYRGAIFAARQRFTSIGPGTKIQLEVFLTALKKNPRVMDVRAFGSWMSAPKGLLFQDYEGLTEVFAPGRPPGSPCGRPRDIRPQNLLRLWAVLSYLILTSVNVLFSAIFQPSVRGFHCPSLKLAPNRWAFRHTSRQKKGQGI